MRTQVIDSIKSLALTGYAVSPELPFDESGTALYLKNQKTIYVDESSTEVEPVITTLDAVDISRETTSVRAYFSIDAKKIPANYDTTISALRSVKSAITRPGSNSRQSNVRVDYTGDLMVVEVEYTLSKLT